MQIAYHIGAHCTDGDLLLKSLQKNAKGFEENGIRIPGPGRYRNKLRVAIQSLGGTMPVPGTRESLLSDILDDQAATRMVLSNPLFICVVKRIFENQQFYHLVEEKTRGMRMIFQEDEIHYFIAMRNQAGFIPAVFAEQNDMDFQAFMRNADPRQMRWSDVIARIRETDPAAQITAWCDEDTPLFWAQLIREIAGVDPMTRITGGFDLLQSLLTEDGMGQFVAHLRARPPRTEPEKRAVIGRFLEEFARPGVMEQEVDLAEWDQSLVNELTVLYREDVARVAALPGVNLITP